MHKRKTSKNQSISPQKVTKPVVSTSAKTTEKTSWLWPVFIALKKAAWKSNEDNCSGLAKEAAYSFILSLFPMLVAIIALFFISGNTSRSIAEMLTTLNRMMPTESYKIVENYIYSMKLSSSPKLFWFSLIGAIWGASGIMGTLQNAFNKIYNIKSKRNFWTQQLMAILLVFLAGVPMFLSTILTIFGEQLEELLIHYYGLDHIWRYLWNWARWAIVLMTVISIAVLVYRVGTERKQKWREVLPGALLATTLWLIATLFFNSYVQRFGSYNQIYGSLGAVIVLLIWMFLTSYALLYGAEFNYQLLLQRENNIINST